MCLSQCGLESLLQPDADVASGTVPSAFVSEGTLQLLSAEIAPPGKEALLDEVPLK